MKERIQTDAAPQAIGPYSQAVRTGGFLFVSGQIPIDPQTGVFPPGGIEAQTARVLENLRAILQSAGGTLDNVVKTTVFLRHMSDFAAMNEVYARYFSGVLPARAAVEVAALPRDALVEIEVIATI